MFSEIRIYCSDNHLKITSTVCGQNIHIFNVKSGGTGSSHSALNDTHNNILFKLNVTWLTE
jgi:hypothetical protein